MRFSLIFKIFLIILLTIFQLSFFKGLGQPWFNTNLLIGITAFFVVFDSLENNLIPVLVGALIIDIFSNHFFGLIIVTVLLTCYSMNTLFLRLFTNRSLSSLIILGVAGSVIYSFLIITINYFFYWLNIISIPIFLNQIFWNNLFWQAILILPTLVVFYLFGMISRKSIKSVKSKV